MVKFCFVLSGVVLAACSSAIITGEPLADIVLSKEAEGWTPCVALGGPTSIFAEDEQGPPAMLHPSSFKDEEVKAAAALLQVGWRDAPEDSSLQIFGTVVGDRCVMQVDRPAISGRIAFVGFSDPGGEMGAYAFRRSGEEWHFVERVVRGYW